MAIAGQILGTAVTLPLLLAESAGLIAFGPIGVIAALTGDAGRSVAWAFLLFNLIGAGLSGLLLPWIAPVLARSWPVTRVEADAQPAFLEDGMLRDPAGALDLAIQLCRGLCHLHDNGVVHYDLKPANLLFDDVGR